MIDTEGLPNVGDWYEGREPEGDAYTLQIVMVDDTHVWYKFSDSRQPHPITHEYWRNGAGKLKLIPTPIGEEYPRCKGVNRNDN